MHNVCLGELGWRSGESTRLPPMWPWFDSQSQRHMWVEYAVGSLLAPRSFSPCSSVFPSPEKPTVRVNPIRPRMHGHMLNELLNTHINKQILKIKLFGPFFLL